ncbi:MAG: hypothetical protein JNK26_01480 [Candidatus Doudnabacteria bacterium]|nr:hypothetical protein [Candidatus Doudnabacteria bacterium]
MRHKHLSGQILVVTLMILIIIAIIVVGVVAVGSKDVLQSITDQRYNELYDAAERSIVGLIDKYGDPTEPLTNLTNSAQVPSGYSCALDPSVSGQYRCTVNSVYNLLFVRDSRDVVDYELNKDDSLTLNMNGYRGTVVVSWTGTAALEFSLIYNDAGTIRNINDLYDNNSPTIFTANGGNPLSDPNNTHAFPFVTNAGGGIRFNIGGITGLPAAATTYALRITPRMSGSAGNILLSVIPQNAGYPNQVRIFNGASLSTQADVGVLAEAITQVPLFPQIANVFQYGFLTGGGIAKN